MNLKKLVEDRRIFIKFSIAHYILNIINIIILFQILLYEEDIGYPIAYLVLYCIDRLISILSIYNGSQKQKFKFWICDFFQVGFLYIIYCKDQPDYISLQIGIFIVRIVPTFLIQLVYFFGCGFLQYTKLSDYLIFLSYLAFLVQSILGAFVIYNILLKKDDPKGNKNIFYCLLLTLSCYYLTLGSFLQFEDNNGIRLGYYALLIAFINYLIYIFFFLPVANVQTFLWESLYYIYTCFLANTIQSFGSYNDEIYTSTLINYYTAFIKLGLLIAFSYDTVWKLLSFDSDQSANQIIVGFNAFFSMILSVIFIIAFFQRVLNYVRSAKKLTIQNTNHFIKARKILQANHKYLKAIYVKIILKKEYIDQMNKQLMLEDFCSNECRRLFDFYKDCSECYKKQIQFYFLNNKFKDCDCYIQRAAKEIEHIFEDQQTQITCKISSSKSDAFLFDILLCRHMNGFLFTTFTQKLSVFKFPPFNEVIQDFQKLKSTSLSIMVFLKHLNQEMCFSPQRILYDLYE